MPPEVLYRYNIFPAHNPEEKDLAFRCNLITENDDILLDYSAGHITDREASFLIDTLNKSLGSREIRFYLGKSYRNLMVY
ncbi:MAG: hypothetical protein DRP72_02330, partial [Candidatus Omnitrophota bacterium]